MKRARQRNSGKRRGHAGGWPRFRRLAFESLEARRLLAVLTVNSTSDVLDPQDGFVTLREAIIAANADSIPDEIRFEASLFESGPQTITLTNGELLIASNLTINGPGVNLLTVDASGNDPTPDSTLDDGNDLNDFDGSRVFNIDDDNSESFIDVSLRGLTITGGDSVGSGGGIFNSEFLSIFSCVIRDNVATRGGGIASDFRVDAGDVTVSNNQSAIRGGGIENRGSWFMSQSTITGNWAGRIGGGIYNSGEAFVFEQGFISGNRAEPDETVAVDPIVAGGGTGGGFESSTGGGGVAHVDGLMELAGIQITGNTTRRGGIADGGGILNRYAELTVIACTVSGNSADGRGGGIANQGEAHVANTTISGNSASFDGGGIFNGDGEFSLTSSTISGNRADRRGGGIALLTYGDYTGRIAHTTITGNTADNNDDQSGSGGGIYAGGDGIVEIEHTIVAGNIDRSGAAPDVDDINSVISILEVRHSLFGTNLGNHLLAAPIGSPDSNGNLAGSAQAPIDPRLEPLASNGGPTQTHALRFDSPAIDAGVPNFEPPPDTDQRGSGFARVIAGRIDIGAFEALANANPIVTPPGAQTVNEGSVLTLPSLGSFTDLDANDTHTATIDWGDGSEIEAVLVDQDLRILDGGSHTYGDDGSFIAIITVTDNRGGSGTETFRVTVNNVAPTLTLSGLASISEGAVYTLNLVASDPGTDTTVSWRIDWGESVQIITGNPASVTHVYADGNAVFTINAMATDGDGTHAAGNTVGIMVNNAAPTLTLSGPASVDEGSRYTLNLASSDPGVDTIIHWEITWGDGAIQTIAGNPASVEHVYADGDATMEVTATAIDEDGAYMAANALSILVRNVVPVLTVPPAQMVTLGTALSLIDLGRIVDPGFNNPNNPQAQPGGTVESFRFFIDWGDGTITTGTATIDEMGGELIATSGSFDGTHTYTTAGDYTVTIRIADDDMSGNFAPGGTTDDYVEREFAVEVAGLPQGIPILPPDPLPPADSIIEVDPDEPPETVPTLLLVTLRQDPPGPPISDGGSGGDIPPPLEFDLSRGRNGGLIERAIQAVYYRPSGVRPQEVIDAVFSLGDIELVSLLGVDMGDDPVFQRKKAEQETTEQPEIVQPPPPPIVVVPTDEQPGWKSVAFWLALAGSSVLWVGGTWWWMKRHRQSLQ